MVSLKSTDGITWTERYDRQLPSYPLFPRSPAVIKIDNYYYIYYVVGTDPNFEIRRSRCTSLEGTFTNEETIVVGGLTGKPWHIDIFLYQGKYWLQLITAPNPIGIWMAYGTDGINFTVPNNTPTVISGDYPWSGVYRPSMMQLDNGKLVMYYGTQAATDGTGRVYIYIK